MLKPDYINLLASALESKKAFIHRLQTEGTNCYRFLSGNKDTIRGLTIDCFDRVGIFQVFENRIKLDESELKEVGEWCLEHLNLKSIYVKQFIEDRSHSKDLKENADSKPLCGVESPEEISVLENGLTFLIRPYDGFSVGLFLDQRENRRFVLENVKNQKVLNLFAYTCAFSVAAAKGGGTVTSVDVSKKYLEWGKKNFAANGLDPSIGRFLCDGIFEVLARLKRQKQEFDFIVLDPPSFGRSKGGVFSLKNDWKKLLNACFEILSQQGTLLFSQNYSEWGDSRFKSDVLVNAKAMGRNFKELELKRAEDFSDEANLLSQICIKEI